MRLAEYDRRRRFDQTREPSGRRAVAASGRPIFVVQLHHASHRHYDFRLQVGGTLRSWAVPKGPSLDPAVKRLAAEVEDHPVAYADFEGEIPEGQYGAGHVALFDRGIWSTVGDAEQQLRNGHLRFELFGEKLKGGWHLIRTGRSAAKPQWLLMKDRDRYAGHVEADDLLQKVVPPTPATLRKRAPATRTSSRKSATVRSKGSAAGGAARRGRQPDSWEARAAAIAGARPAAMPTLPPAPQLASLVPKPPQGEGWLHEIKWDGYRITAMIDDGRVRLWSRNALEWTSRLPDIVAALEQRGLRQAVFDGELIARRGGQKDFSALQSTLAGDRHEPLVYVVFDVLHLDGISLMEAALSARKQLLAALLALPDRHLAQSTHSVGDGSEAFVAAIAEGFEGIVSKRADGRYHPGRDRDWQKTKTRDSSEFAVVGYTAPRGSRAGFGSLLLARHDDRSGWVYAGKVGSGFADTQLAQLRRRIGQAGRKEPTVMVPANDTDLRSAKWFAPMFVVEVMSRGLGSNGLLRQPSLKTIRLDKEIADMAPASTAERPSTPADDMKLTSPDKILFPADGITKQQVADYYLAVMPQLLPEIVDRPLSIMRCPGGIAGTCFFQKHHASGLAGVDAVSLADKSGARDDYLVARDAAAVMQLVQFNSIEFHPWGARAESPDQADRLVFDLDPGSDVPWTQVRAAARQVRALLEKMKLKSFLRTSGGKGLHVVVPLNPPAPWNVAKPFAEAVAASLAAQHPDRFVATATKSRRQGRIFIDYLRNGRGATAVASYSLRARDRAPVALPVDWSQLGRVSGGAQFTISNVPRRIAMRRQDPWAGIDTIRQSLPALPARAASRKRSR